MQEFKNYHPIINFFYFLSVMLLSCFYLHPIFTVISLVCAFVYSIMLDISKSKLNICLLILIIPLSSLINSFFNHEGMTILTYFSDGNPLTAESIIYGAVSGAMLSAIVSIFFCYNKTVTSDKFIYIFGKITPSLSLIFSMTLRFVPKFRKKLKEISDGQKGIMQDDAGTFISKIKRLLRILSIMVTWALESAVDTADSMRSRGYGFRGRSAYSNFVFDKRDLKALLSMILFLTYTLIGIFSRRINYVYFPTFKTNSLTPYTISVITSYFLLCSTPIIIEIYEAIRWKLLRQKI